MLFKETRFKKRASRLHEKEKENLFKQLNERLEFEINLRLLI